MSHVDRRMLRIGLPAAVLAGAVAGVLSQMAIEAWPSVCFVGPIAVGIAAGGAVGVLSLRLNCPRVGLVLTLGVVGAVAGNAASWWQAIRSATSREFVWVESARDFDVREQGDFIQHGVLEKRPPLERQMERARPGGLGEYLDWRARHGWGEHGEPHHQVIVAVVYVGELLLGMLAAAVTLGTAVFSKPYCMTHKRWARPELTVIMGEIDLTALSKAVEARDIDRVVVAPRSKGSRSSVTYLFQRCPACDSTMMTLWMLGRRKPALEEVPVTPEQVRACVEALAPPVTDDPASKPAT